MDAQSTKTTGLTFLLFVLCFASLGCDGQDHRAALASQTPATEPSVASEKPLEAAVSSESTSDWCAEHGVPESACTRCHPELIDKFKAANDWCGGHNLPESLCVLCNPEVKAKLDALRPKSPTPTVDWCAEHGVPESACTRCHPELIDKFKAANDWCGGHNLPESLCVLCNPEVKAKLEALRPKPAPTMGGTSDTTPRSKRPPNVYCVNSNTLVSLGSSEIASTVDLGFAPVQTQSVSEERTRNAEIAYDERLFAHLASRAPGAVSEVLKDLGDAVVAGEVLAIIDSVELGAAKAELLQALETQNLRQANAQRERSLVDQEVGTEREAFEAETHFAESRIALSKARQRLRNLGLKQGQIDSVEKDGETSSELHMVAPFDGLVVERSAVMGEMVEPSSTLFAIANTSRMWAMIDLRETDLMAVRMGQAAIITVDGLPGQPFAGRVTWISTQLDPRTRTLKARADVENHDGLLRANMFGQAQIATRVEEQAVTVPKEAVHWEGCCNVVFVKNNEEGTEFKPTKVQIGIETGDRYEVLSGLKGSEVVATRGSFLLKTEILKGSIGAGCCEVEHLAK